MVPESIDVSDTEFQILHALWENGPSTIRQITDQLYPHKRTTSAYATIQKMLDRLELKGCVVRDRSSFAHVFRPAIERSDFLASRLRDLAEKLCGGSYTPLLIHLVERVQLGEHDREILDRLMSNRNG